MGVVGGVWLSLGMVPQPHNLRLSNPSLLIALRPFVMRSRFGYSCFMPFGISRRQQYRNSLGFPSFPSTTPSLKLTERNECLSEPNVRWRDFKARVKSISPAFDKRSSDTEIIRIDQSENTNSTSIQLDGLEPPLRRLLHRSRRVDPKGRILW
ncbi:hypothetical protein HN51_059958 [Arachis hypogaea]|uniref:Uncharacterized protein n=1 Tax=Arachis hypogaea TaxID=3818 RepID=A0A444X7X6_ARAHY|nr:hypothetical protein Ahy_B10g105405 [Arachis hypogaea]